MKAVLVILITYSSLLYAGDISPQARDMKFVTDFTGFTCKSFSDQVSTPEDISDLQISFDNDSYENVLFDKLGKMKRDISNINNILNSRAEDLTLKKIIYLFKEFLEI